MTRPLGLGVFRNNRAFLLTVIALCLAQLAHSHYDLGFDRQAVARGDWWRIVSGQFVHNNSAHCLMNILALFGCRLLFLREFSERTFLALLARFTC